MSKSDTIAAIMRINRSAPAEFLAEFSAEDLQSYLDRLASQRGAGRSHGESSPPARANPTMPPVTRPSESPFRLSPSSTRT